MNRMLELHKKKSQQLEGSSDLARIEREIEVTDREIDELVYELYGLSEDEIKIVEGE